MVDAEHQHGTWSTAAGSAAPAYRQVKSRLYYQVMLGVNLVLTTFTPGMLCMHEGLPKDGWHTAGHLQPTATHMAAISITALQFA